jgi:hypothetical protein
MAMKCDRYLFRAFALLLAFVSAAPAWSNVPLRQSLTRFCRSRKLAFVLDRRIDPDQKIELTFEDVPLGEAIKRIASRLEIGVAMVGPVAYFGPKPTAESIRTIAALRVQDATKLPAMARGTWTQLRPLKWPDAMSPRDLLTNLGRENKVEIDSTNLLPHDLWAAGDLPALSLPERLTLLLAQFDLTFEIAADGRSVSLTPMPADPKIERNYTVPAAGQDIANRLRENGLLTSAEITQTGAKLLVRARQEDHDVIKELLSGRQAKRSTIKEKQVYTLRVILTVDKLLDALAKRLEMEFKIDREAISARGLSLDKEVKIDVKEVSADELLRAVLDPVGLTFKRSGKVVEVIPKP